jgi:acyl carrier protein
MYIGGEGVAEGYLGRAEITAERFIANPFREGQRMYRTGDLATWRGEGEMEYLGRYDNQVKYHGYRVELDEIRITLNGHPQIKDSAVMVRRDGSETQTMVAYYVSVQPLEASVLRAFLSERLIAETIPSLFVHMNQLPLTLNGKINYEALPALAEARDKIKQTLAAPRTKTEEILAGIWAEVLGIEKVGIHDTFFDLGGHSLLATRVAARVRAAFQVKLSLRSLLEGGTVAKLAEKIDAGSGSERGSKHPPLQQVSRKGVLPLSYAQQQLWFLDQLKPGSLAYNTSIAIRLEGTLSTAVMEQCLNEVVRRHEALRTTFPAVKGRPFQAIAPSLCISLPVVDLSGLNDCEAQDWASQLAKDEAWRPFDLVRGPLLRGTLLRLDQQVHVELFSIHHIVSDGWSSGLLIREVTTLYQAFSTGMQSGLPDLTIQYADFASWQRLCFQGKALDEQIAYWKRQLSGVPLKLNLPAARPEPLLQTGHSAREPMRLSQNLTKALNVLGRQEQVTLFMTLLAAFKVILHYYSGQDHIVAGTAVANRNRVEVERLIGFFANLLVLHTDLSGNPTFKQLLARVREVLLGAYTHQEVPFDLLVEALSPDRGHSATPLIQATMVLQNAGEASLEFAGLKVKELKFGTGTAKFDWLLSIEESSHGLVGSLEYNVDMFDKATVTRALTHFDTVLQKAVLNPDVKLSELLEILSSDDKRHQSEMVRTLKAYRSQKFGRVKRKAIITHPSEGQRT